MPFRDAEYERQVAELAKARDDFGQAMREKVLVPLTNLLLTPRGRVLFVAALVAAMVLLAGVGIGVNVMLGRSPWA